MSAAGPLSAPVERLDLRLALGAAGAWLAVVVCLDRSARVTLVVAILCATAGVLALAAAARGVATAAGAALVVFCAALVLLPFAGRLAHSRASPLARLADARAVVTAELTVTSDPRQLAATGVAGAPRVVVDARADGVRVNGQQVTASGAVVVFGAAEAWRSMVPGQRVRLDGVLQPARGVDPMTVALFARSDPIRLGGPPWWQRVASDVRSSLRQACAGLPTDVRGLLPGLVDGDTSDLDPVLAERFRTAGLTHLVAVSGTNCSILVGAVLLTLRRLRAGPRTCAACGALVLVAFVVVARPSPSVLRAAVMAAIAMFALASGRPRRAVPGLAGAVLALLLWNPALAVNAGFTMSVLATAALLVIAPSWAEALRRRRVPPVLAESTAVAAAAHLVTAPVIVALSGRVSLVAIPANVLAEPMVAPATVLGFLAAVVSPLWLAGGRLAAELAGWPCRWLAGVASYLGGLRGATLPWAGGAAGGLALLGLAATILAVARWPVVRRAMLAAAMVALVIQIPVRTIASGWPPPGWLFVACDVGQGDALVLSAGPHSGVVVDAGPDPVAVDRCLRELGVVDVALLAISHDHLDHVAGVDGVLHGRHVGQVMTGPLALPIAGAALLGRRLAARGLASAAAGVGRHLTIGRVQLDIVAPGTAFHDTRSDPNNSSLVLRATVAGVRILLPGDVEIEAQQRLLESSADLRADVLKVPHHGSAYFEAAFLMAIHARVGVISVGAGNDYGHPAGSLLTAMATLGVPLRRTDLDGDVAITDSGGLLVSVSHGRRSSTTAIGELSRSSAAAPGGSARSNTAAPGWPRTRAGLLPVGASGGSARMAPCPLAPCPPGSCPIRCPRWWCCWVTRSCWSGEPSARSPPRLWRGTPRWCRPSGSARRSTVRSCPRCWGRRCSVMPDSWSSAPPTSCGPRRWLGYGPTC